MSSGTPEQYAAADPAASVWVGASAGTGKTKVLTDRVLRLMLAGVAPERILCITFTKAAAMEMASRISTTLARWAVVDDLQLSEGIAELCGVRPDDAAISAARRLFARVLDAPGSLHIETIHAFCQSVLKRFPLEAGVPPHFEVLDDLSSDELLAHARRDMIASIRSGVAPDSLRNGLAAVSAWADETGFAGILRALLSERGRFMAATRKYGGVAHMLRAVARTLGIPPGETPEDALLDACRNAGDAALREACAFLDEGTDPDRTRAREIRSWFAAGMDARAQRFDEYASIFLTAENEPRKRVTTKASADAAPALEAEQKRLLEARRRHDTARCLAATSGLAHLAGEILADYHRRKQARALLDYDDLVLATRTLITKSASADWVLYKLDGGFDHILVDEAQDTNPDQWEVISRLAEEYFSGSGAREGERTLFVVGDVKQSIFSFQKADPAGFSRMREFFRHRITDSGHLWREIPLDVSFRSVPAVLQAVDAVFARPEASGGVADGAPITHRSRRGGHAGMVEVWPLVEAAEKSEDENAPAPPHPSEILAGNIASTIRTWLSSGEMLPARGRPMAASDILILVRQRGPFFTRMLRALRGAGIPVAGADRMILGEQIAVMDMLALAKALLLPEDDLNLACVLKSPLIGMDEELLFALAHNRGHASLWERLGTSAHPAARASRAYLSGLMAQADFTPPYEILETILGTPCPADQTGSGRRAFLKRLGLESTDALDELLNKALAFERLNPPSLQSFVLWMEGGPSEIKRDMDEGRMNEVRIMTVHGAKGLQAPVVILPDTASLPRFREQVIWTDDAPPLPLWAPPALRQQETVARRIETLKARAQEEYRRLLYVAMTRAADRLIVCGFSGRQENPGNWHELVKKGIEDIAAPFPLPFAPEQAGWRLETPQTAPVPSAKSAAAADTQASLPAWIASPAPPEPKPSRPIAPSKPQEDEPAAFSPIGGGEDDANRFQRGLLIHKLLQTLPDVPQARRAEMCRAFLASPAHGLSDARAQAIAGEVLALLDNPALSFLFAGGSLAEVPIAGRISDDVVISGQIDRLAFRGNEVMIVDYKTNRPPAREPEETPAPYLRQMATYRAALRRIYPDKTVTCALLWTDACHLMMMPDILLDAHAP